MRDISFKLWLCNQDSFNGTRGKDHGISNLYSWFHGIPTPAGNKIQLDWVGKHNLSMADIKDQLFKNDFSKVVVKRTRLGHKSKADARFDHLSSETFLLDSGLCRVLDVSNYIRFRFTDNNEYKIFVSEVKQSSLCGIAETSMSGDFILSNLYDSTKFYTLRLEITEYNQKAGECQEYAGHDANHADCEAEWFKAKFTSMLGCVVPWLPSSRPCTRTLVENQTISAYSQLIESMVHKSFLKTGCSLPACPQPCQGVKIHSRLTQTTHSRKLRQVSLEFDPSVKVTRYVMAYGSFELIVDVGSSLGLWIGLTFIGLFDGFRDIVQLIVKKAGNRGQSFSGGSKVHVQV